MALDIKSVIGAYTNTASLKGGMETPYIPGEGPESFKPTFRELLGESLDRARDSGYIGETQSIKSIANQAELHELVNTVTNAELTLQTVVTVRDRMVSAYQDIIKMPI